MVSLNISDMEIEFWLFRARKTYKTKSGNCFTFMECLPFLTKTNVVSFSDV